MWIERYCLLASRAFAAPTAAETIVIQPRLVHLRNDPQREWSSFPEQAEAAFLEAKFHGDRQRGRVRTAAAAAGREAGLAVLLNGKPLGELVRDEADR